MIHYELMKKKGGEYLDPDKQEIVRRYSHAANDHETLRTLLKDIWLQNLSKFPMTYSFLFVC